MNTVTTLDFIFPVCLIIRKAIKKNGFRGLFRKPFFYVFYILLLPVSVNFS
jgi:hypothetical protein